MSKTRQWVICAALAIVVVMTAGWFLLVSPQRAKAAALRTQTATEQDKSATLRTSLDVLTAQSKRLPSKRAELAKFARLIPSGPALPTMIRALQHAATTAGVTLVSIAPLPPAPFAASVTPAQPAAAAPPTSASASPAPPAAAPAAGGSPSAVPPTAVTGSPLQSITWNTKVTGSYVELAQFVANLEDLPRLFVVTAYTMSPDTAVASASTSVGCTARACLIDLDVTGQAFIAPTLTAPVARPVTPTPPSTPPSTVK